MESSELTNKLNLSFENKFGEIITFKVDNNGKPYFNHSDIHDSEFEPTEKRYMYVLDEDEKSIFNLFETMAFIQKLTKIK